MHVHCGPWEKNGGGPVQIKRGTGAFYTQCPTCHYKAKKTQIAKSRQTFFLLLLFFFLGVCMYLYIVCNSYLYVHTYIQYNVLRRGEGLPVDIICRGLL